jgi:hypothetical protein
LKGNERLRQEPLNLSREAAIDIDIGRKGHPWQTPCTSEKVSVKSISRVNLVECTYS